MNLSINKLIANDIVGYSMSQTNHISYIFSLDTYLKDFDDESKKYVSENIEEIFENIKSNENIFDIDANKQKNTIHIIFYWEKLLNEVEKKIDNTAKILGVKMTLKDIKEIAENMLDDDTFSHDLINKLLVYDYDRDMNS